MGLQLPEAQVWKVTDCVWTVPMRKYQPLGRVNVRVQFGLAEMMTVAALA